MNNSALRLFVRSILAEAKDKKAKETAKKSAKKPEPKKAEPKKAEPKKSEPKKSESKPKSSGKLVDLKKEVAYLKQMSEQLQEMGLTEGSEIAEAEFSNLQKFVNELTKIKEASASLKTTLEEEITATETKIQDEKNKIKEMMGLVPENIHNTAQMGGVTTSKGTAGYINNPDSKKGGDYDPKKAAAAQKGKKESYDGGAKDLATMARSSNASRNKPETKELAKKAAEQAKSKDEASNIAVKLAKAKGIKDSEQITHIVDLAVSMFKNK